MSAHARAADDPTPGRGPRRPVLLPALLIVLTLAVTACGSEEPPAPTTTTGTALPPRTTLPQVVTTAPSVATTTTLPAEIATEVDACALLRPREVRAVAGEQAGRGTPVAATDLPGQPRTDGEDGAGDAADPPVSTTDDTPSPSPVLLLSGCSWPTDGPPAVTLSYLAPTTSRSALEHLQRLIELDSRFARGARVFPLPPEDDLGPAALVDEAGAVIEVAVVTGSALLYVVPSEPPPSGSPEASALVDLLMAAARRAPG